MAVTTVVGIDRAFERLYQVTLDPDTGLISIPPHLAQLLPARGRVVEHFPSETPVVFDREDPVAVFAWLTSETSIVRVDGPDLAPGYDTDPDAIY